MRHCFENLPQRRLSQAKEHEVKLTQNNKNSVEAVDALATIRERSTTFKDLQVNVSKLKDKHGKNKQDKEQKPKIPNSKTVRIFSMMSNENENDPLTHDAWNKKCHHKGHRPDPFQFDPQYKSRKSQVETMGLSWSRSRKRRTILTHLSTTHGIRKRNTIKDNC